MPTARRMQHKLSPEELAEIKRDLRKELIDEITGATSVEDLQDALDERHGEPLSYSDIAGMSADQINASWSLVSEVLAHGPGADPMAQERAANAQHHEPPPPRATGHAPVGEGNPVALTMDAIRSMSVEEHIARRQEVEAFLSRGGAA